MSWLNRCACNPWCSLLTLTQPMDPSQYIMKHTLLVIKLKFNYNVRFWTSLIPCRLPPAHLVSLSWQPVSSTPTSASRGSLSSGDAKAASTALPSS